ncbi:MAG: non-canonical purine NTP pyrophosphatase, RdgB/HAM1 family [Thermoplasmata archaeon]|nr:MAG: non-canonical purine NTP pyrophosphatase, RdgB/HAM1 family [Thermoplasmata archaeon]
MRVYFVTSNDKKFEEASKVFSSFAIKLERINRKYVEIQADKLEEVAEFSARYLMDNTPKPFILEDSGLFIDALKGFPGVYSSYVFRTIGLQGVLSLMEGKSNRGARFLSVVAVVHNNEVVLCRGVCEGHISHTARGHGGFGFDPIFIPRGEKRTFAEMSAADKNAYSHRGKSMRLAAKYIAENMD